MKLISIIATALLCASMCFANPLQPTPPIVLTNIGTNSASVTTNSQSLGANGLIEAVFVGVTNSFAAATNSLTLTVSLQSAMGISRTLYSASSITASSVYYPRINEQNTGGVATNVPARMPTYGDNIVVTAYNTGTTNTTVKVWTLISNPQ